MNINAEIKDKILAANTSNNILGTVGPGLSGTLLEEDSMKELLLGHKNHVEEMELSLDEEIGDGITTKEFIYFSSKPNVIDSIMDENKLKSGRPEGQIPAIFALNLGQYLFYGNPSELMGALISYSDKGVIFTTPENSKQRYNGKSESIANQDTISIVPKEVIDAGEFFRRYGYNEKYDNFFGRTIEAWKAA